MGWTDVNGLLEPWLGGEVLLAAGLYSRRPDGSYQYDGARPGDGWHAHGYFSRNLVSVAGGGRVDVRIWKRRWKRVDGGEGPLTRHSRPPDDIASLSCCAAVVMFKLWCWLSSPVGLERVQQPEPLERCGSRRSLQRWLRRARRCALQSLQALRHTVIERSEPRPVEQLFVGGVPPPEELARLPWHGPVVGISQLRQGLAFLVGGASALNISIPVLLAEARGRHRSADNFLM